MAKVVFNQEDFSPADAGHMAWWIRCIKKIYNLYDSVTDYNGLAIQQGWMSLISPESNGRMFRSKKACGKT